jgi:ribosomal protein L22
VSDANVAANVVAGALANAVANAVQVDLRRLTLQRRLSIVHARLGDGQCLS